MLKDDSDGLLFKHLILNSIRSYIQKYRYDYGSEIVISVDAKDTWRKQFFPEYKSQRKKSQKEDEVDWDWVFGVINELVIELDAYFPYKVVKVLHAEADDIIGTLVKEQHKYQNIIIISSDGDFKQLHKYPGVKQFSPIQKKEIKDETPEISLREKIIRGDSGDGIPNFLSPNRTFVDGIRQKPIRKNDVEKWLNQPVERTLNELGEEAQIGFERNNTLINLDKIPDWLANQILDEYNREHHGSMNKVLNYLSKNDMRELIKSWGEFKP